MSSSRNWSHNSFERAMKRMIPLIKFYWMEHLKVSPIEYSEWSDTISVVVEFKLNREGERILSSMDFREQYELPKKIGDYLSHYVHGFLNTNIIVKEFRTF